MAFFLSHKGILVTLLITLCFRCALVNPPEDTPARKELSDVVITEIHYNPLPSGTVSGDEYEFLELYNRSTSEISLSQVSVSDGVSYQFTDDATIKAGEYLVLASNEIEFEKRYGFKPYDVYTGKLKNSGERVALMDLTVQREFFEIEYSDQSPWPLAADGAGYSLVPISAAAQDDLTKASQWRASFRLNGSPGKADPGPVYVNEVLSHTDPPDEDAIELYNPNSTPVDISGWYLSDSKTNPMKYRIPDGTVIEAGGYLVFYSHHFADSTLPYPFNLSENGEEAYLFEDSTGTRNGGYFHGFAFDALENGVTFGRYINSSGDERFVEQERPSLGSANTGPVSCSVVFTEIMYNPQNGRDEYIEIRNISSRPVSLFHPDFPENTWKIRGFDFSFPAGINLQSGEVVVVTTDTISADEFRSLYNVPSNVRIFDSAKGKLRNSSDTLTLMEPLKPDSQSGKVPYRAVERVAYEDKGLWPVSADGGGAALMRKDPDLFADDPTNWTAGPPSPGR